MENKEAESYIDLHTHSSMSDGSLTPTQLVEAAQAEGLAALAITDHDTVDGLDEGLAAAGKSNMEMVAGIEISVDARSHDGSPASLHILGYFIDHHNQQLASALGELVENRDQRNRKMIERLNKLGMVISLEEVEKYKKSPGTLGRPHFAQALIAKGYAKDNNDVFKRFLRRGAPAYVEKRRLNPEEGVNLIINAGGLAALAHPGHFLPHPQYFNNLLVTLKSYGLKGLECYYSEYSDAQMQALLSLAHRHHLAPCGGSDFHGEMKANVHLGSGRGWLKVPYCVLENLKAAR